MAGDGEWQEVRRRRRFPDNWRTPSDDRIDQVRAYKPYQLQRTYAQVLSGNFSNSSKASTGSNSARTSPGSSRPASPTSPTSPKYYYSPHSPTKLRFPPSPSFSEWWGRCFNCCRVGHTASKCRNPKRCGKCWATGHTGRLCNATNLNPAAPPYHPKQQVHIPLHTEPLFDDLLQGKLPPQPEMPEGRPDKIMCFIERDEDFYKEVQRLGRAVVLNGNKAMYALEVHQVVGIAVDTGLVREEEIRIAQLSQDTFLIHLPMGLAVDTFVKATPSSLWDAGFRFEHWSQIHNANVVVPRFKVLIDLIGIPMHIWDEKKVARMVSKFGLFLGTIAPEHATNFMTFRVAIATDDLSRIPLSMGIVAGGTEHPVRLRPVAWKRGAIYDASDFPKAPPRLQRPPSPPPSNSSSPEDFLNTIPTKNNDDSDLIVCSKRVLFELCHGLNPTTIPPEVLAVLTGAKHTAEITIETLKDLLQAAEDQKHENSRMAELPSPELPILNQNMPIVQPASHRITNNLHVASDFDEQTVTPTYPGSPRKAHSSRVEKDKGIDASGDAGETSVQGTVHQLPIEERNAPYPMLGIGCGELPRFRANKAAEGPQIIPYARSHVHKHINKSVQLQPFNTSRHIRFRGMLGRGKGRVGAQGSSQTVYFNEAGQRGRRKRDNCWVRTPKPTQRITPTPLPTKDKSTEGGAGPSALNTHPMNPVMQVDISLGQSSGEAHQGIKRKPPTTMQSGPEIKQKKPPLIKNIPEPPQAEIDLNPEGHYRVSIQQNHAEQIAEACGVSTEGVFQMLSDDNLDRQLVGTVPQEENDAPTEEEIRQSNARFQIDSDEEIDSQGAC